MTVPIDPQPPTTAIAIAQIPIGSKTHVTVPVAPGSQLATLVFDLANVVQPVWMHLYGSIDGGKSFSHLFGAQFGPPQVSPKTGLLVTEGSLILPLVDWRQDEGGKPVMFPPAGLEGYLTHLQVVTDSPVSLVTAGGSLAVK